MARQAERSLIFDLQGPCLRGKLLELSYEIGIAYMLVLQHSVSIDAKRASP